MIAMITITTAMTTIATNTTITTIAIIASAATCVIFAIFCYYCCCSVSCPRGSSGRGAYIGTILGHHPENMGLGFESGAWDPWACTVIVFATYSSAPPHEAPVLYTLNSQYLPE